MDFQNEDNFDDLTEKQVTNQPKHNKMIAQGWAIKRGRILVEIALTEK